MGVSVMSPEGIRETSLMNFYSAERRAGACPLVANERMAEFAKRLDAQFEAAQAAVATEMERTDEAA